jgi:murein DD-endopeptidase MepM/ murein hydrolase activator NlpD
LLGWPASMASPHRIGSSVVLAGFGYGLLSVLMPLSGRCGRGRHRQVAAQLQTTAASPLLSQALKVVILSAVKSAGLAADGRTSDTARYSFLLASVDDHRQLREFLMQSSAAALARRRLRQWCLLAFALLLAACSSAPNPVATPTNSAEAQFRSAPPPPPFVHPVPGARVSSMFAKHIVKSRNRKHHGVDFAAPQGTPVYAASSGVVLNADMGSLSDAFGKVVLIEHGDKLQSLSAHLSRIDVQIGDFVQAGQQIGLVGKTGRATGPHLHFELWRNGYPQDPMRYLPNGAAAPQRTSP